MTAALPRKSDDDSGSEISDSSHDDNSGAAEFPSQLFMTKDDKRKKSKREDKASTSPENADQSNKKHAKGKPKLLSNASRGDVSKKKGKKSNAKKHKKEQSLYGGSAMPRQKTAGADGGGGKSSFMTTLESLMNPTEDSFKNKNKDHDNDAASQGAKERGGRRSLSSKFMQTLNNSMRGRFGGDNKEGDDDDRDAKHDDKMTKSDSSKHGGSKRNKKRVPVAKQDSFHDSVPSNLDYNATSPNSKSSSRGGHAKRRGEKWSDLNASVPDRLDYSSDEAGDVRSDRRRQRQKGRVANTMNASLSDLSGDEKHRSDNKQKGGRGGKTKKLNSSKPDASDDIGHSRGEGRTNSDRRGRRQKDMSASMPEQLDSGSENTDDGERRRIGPKKRTNKVMSTSMPDRSDSTGLSGSSRRRNEDRRRRLAQNSKTDHSVGGNEKKVGSDTMPRSFDGSISIAKTDEETLLAVMSERMAKDLYFPEVGFFDWKKWRRSKVKSRRRRRRNRRLLPGASGEPAQPHSADGNRDLNYNDRPDQSSFDPKGPTRQLGSTDQVLRPRSTENYQSRTDEVPPILSKKNKLPASNGNVNPLLEQSTEFGDSNNFADVGRNKSTPVAVNVDFGMFGDIQEGLDDGHTSFETDNITGADRTNDKGSLEVPTPSMPENLHADLENDNDNDMPLLPTRKPPARASRIIGVDDNVQEANIDHVPVQLARQDSAARELKKLATFMTAIDVLSKQEPAALDKQKDPGAACCVIL